MGALEVLLKGLNRKLQERSMARQVAVDGAVEAIRAKIDGLVAKRREIEALPIAKAEVVASLKKRAEEERGVMISFLAHHLGEIQGRKRDALEEHVRNEIRQNVGFFITGEMIDEASKQADLVAGISSKDREKELGKIDSQLAALEEEIDKTLV